MSQSYYNTTGCADRELRERNGRAMSQEGRVLDFFKRHPDTGFTPSQIMQRVLPGAAPTSTRRAITNLTNQKKLVKTSELKPGPYGDPEHVWKLRTEAHHANPQRELLI